MQGMSLTPLQRQPADFSLSTWPPRREVATNHLRVARVLSPVPPATKRLLQLAACPADPTPPLPSSWLPSHPVSASHETTLDSQRHGCLPGLSLGVEFRSCNPRSAIRYCNCRLCRPRRREARFGGLVRVCSVGGAVGLPVQGFRSFKLQGSWWSGACTVPKCSRANHEGDCDEMEAPRSSRPSSPDGEEPEYHPKVRDIETVDEKASSAQVKGESSNSQAAMACPQDVPETSGVAGNGVDNDMEMILRNKIKQCGLADMRVPEMRMSGCSDCDQTESDDEDDDICSTSSDESDDSFNPFASGVTPPVLPDIQLRVPMENEEDVKRVKNALLVKGVLEVVCDVSRQTVTVTGVVPPSRLLKKLRQVNRQARLLSTVSPLAVFVNPHFRSSSFALHDDYDDAHSHAIDIPAANPLARSHHRPRPTFQRYQFHNDPHSPYLRTFSFSDLSPPSSSPSFSPAYVTGDAFDHHRRLDASFSHDDLVL